MVTTLPQDPASLLDAVIADPKRFCALGFAFTNNSATVAQRNETAKEVARKDRENLGRHLSDTQRAGLPKWPVGDTFSEWEPGDVRRWPADFVCAHWGVTSDHLHYYFYERAHIAVLEGKRGMLLARPNRGLKREVGFTKSSRTMAAADNDKAVAIFEHIGETGHRLFANGEELARLLVTLAPWR